MAIKDRIQRKRVYSEIIELSPWEFCDNSLLPGPILIHSCNMKMKLFSYYYWNIFNRVEDKKITYEIPLINMGIFDQTVDFLDERRLLFNTTVNSIFDKSMIQVETSVHKSAYPFEQVAYCNWHGVECWHNDSHDWIFGEFDEMPGITPELSYLLPEAQDSSVENVQTVINKINNFGAWVGPVETSHRILHSYCEYGYMGGFMNYVGPIISSGKDSLLRWMQANAESYPEVLTNKLDYRNSRLWIYIKKAFYFDEDVLMRSYYLNSGNKHYIKHDLYSLKPWLLKNIFLEEYTI